MSQLRSKYNSNREKKINYSFNDLKQRRTLLSFSEKTALLGGITSENNGDFYCLNCFHYFRTKNKFGSHKKICENKGFCDVIMPFEDTKELKLNQHLKCNKMSYIIYADLESLIKNGCGNNAEKSSTAKIHKHIPCGCSISKIWEFDGIEKKHNIYRGEDCMKTFGESLREHSVKIINSEKKKITPLTNKQPESHVNAKICYICKGNFLEKYLTLS